MKRCTHCFRYSLSQPSFCTYCGRSYNVRRCPRGHINPRTAGFCSECGSADLSTPAPPAGVLFHLSQWALRLVFGSAVVILAFVLVAGLLTALDWEAIAPSLVSLGLMLAFLYWTSTLLPGPVKRLGKGAGRKLVHGFRKKRKHE